MVVVVVVVVYTILRTYITYLLVNFKLILVYKMLLISS
jgi:hypothetical protein